MLSATKIAGKCLTRIRMIDLNKETVCSGTSCLKATRNPASTAIAPCIVVILVSISAKCTVLYYYQDLHSECVSR